MKAIRTVAALLAAFACLAATRQDEPTYSLVWKPTEGQTLDYELGTKFSADGESFEMLSDIHLRIVKIEEDGGYTLESSQKNQRMIHNGQQEQADTGGDEEAEVQTERYDAHGKKIKEAKKDDDDEDEEEPSGFAAILKTVADFDSPEKPVKKGETWVKEVKEDKDREIRAGKITYEVTGETKMDDVPVVLVSLKYRDNEGAKPMTCEGTIVFEKKDMSFYRIDASVKDAPFDEDTMGEITLKMTRK